MNHHSKRDKRRQRGDTELAITFVVGAVFVVGWLIFAWVSCSSRWKHSSLPTSWGPIQGCLVHMPSGRWIPEERVRDIDINSAPAQPKATP